MNIKNGFLRLATALMREGKREKAVSVLDKCYEEMPMEVIAPNYYDIFTADAYYKTDCKDKAVNVITRLAADNLQEMKYVVSLSPDQQETLGDDFGRNIAIAHEIIRVMRDNKDIDNSRLYSQQYAEALEAVPLLSNMSGADIESQDFYQIFSRLSNTEKQLVQTYLYMQTDEGN